MAIEFHEFDRDGDLLLLLTSPPEYDEQTDSKTTKGEPSITPGTKQTLKFPIFGTFGVDTSLPKTFGSGPDSPTSNVDESVRPEENTETLPDVHMLVQSRALMLVSPVFKAMLRNNGFQEGNALHSSGKLSVPLPDDDPGAFRILMDIAHHRTRQVPKNVSLEMLTQLAVLIDKYQMLETVEPYVDLWVASEEVRSSLPSISYAADSWSAELHPWLCVSWVFNLPDEFKLVSGMLMRHSLFTVDARLGTQDLPIPGVVIDKIEETRQNVIESAISIVQETIKKYQGPGTSCDSRYNPHLKPSQSACDAQILGFLLRGSAAIGIWPPGPMPHHGTSWSGLSTEIRLMEVRGLCDDYFQNTVQMQWRIRREHTYLEGHGVKAALWAKIGQLDKLVEGLDLATFK